MRGEGNARRGKDVRGGKKAREKRHVEGREHREQENGCSLLTGEVVIG